MYDSCLACGHYCEEGGFPQEDDSIVCDACGHRHPLPARQLFVVLGTPGTGKSTLYNQVLTMPDRPDMVYLETDYFLALASDGWRSLTGYAAFLSAMIGRSGRPVVLFSGGDTEDFEETPTRKVFSEVHYLVLVCSPEIQEQRLRARPKWRSRAHEESIPGWLDWTRMFIEGADRASPSYALLDTGARDREACAKVLFGWLRERSASG